MNASQAPLLEIVRFLQSALATGATTATIDVLDPDAGRGHYAGERIVVSGAEYVHRPFRVWVDLAERLGMRLLTPRVLVDGNATPPLLRLTFERLDYDSRALAASAASTEERYGASSTFARISKLDDPSFVVDLAEALERVALRPHARVLDLGPGRGDELALMLVLEPALRSSSIICVDHSASAIELFRRRLAELGATDVRLHVADVGDVNALAALALGRFDLVVSIGLFQSGALDDRELLRRLVQDHLAPEGALILGMPNCRYIDGEVEYGARMKNFRQPELGLLVKDIAFYRKYLQQHRRKVFITGKNYLFVTAISDSDVATAPLPART